MRSSFFCSDPHHALVVQAADTDVVEFFLDLRQMLGQYDGRLRVLGQRARGADDPSDIPVWQPHERDRDDDHARGHEKRIVLLDPVQHLIDGIVSVPDKELAEQAPEKIDQRKRDGIRSHDGKIAPDDAHRQRPAVEDAFVFLIIQWYIPLPIQS